MAKWRRWLWPAVGGALVLAVLAGAGTWWFAGAAERQAIAECKAATLRFLTYPDTAKFGELKTSQSPENFTDAVWFISGPVDTVSPAGIKTRWTTECSAIHEGDQWTSVAMLKEQD